MKDVTKSAGIHFTHSNGGSGRHYMVEQFSGGCAFLDYDSDGWQDIFLVQSASLPDYKAPRKFHSALYRNNRHGAFSDVTKGSGLDIGIYGMAPAVGDYDNDGRPDLYVTALGGNRLFHNEGHGKFRDVTTQAGVAGKDLSTSAAWLDYDRDGRLDLFVCRYTDYSLERDVECVDQSGRYAFCDPTAYPGTYSLLYRNNGDGTFADVTQKSGLRTTFVQGVLEEQMAKQRMLSQGGLAGSPQNSQSGKSVGRTGFLPGRSMGVACADYNNDGWIDIYLSNDRSFNHLFVNNGNGTFREEAALVGVSFGFHPMRPYGGMGVDYGDYKNEGRIGLVVTNFALEPISLYYDNGSGTFSNEIGPSGMEPTGSRYVKWGCRFVDLDADGWQDLFVVNGHVDDYADEDKSKPGYAQPCQVFYNQKGKFKDISRQCGSFFSRRQVGRGAAFGDYDNDGDTDVLIACNNQPAILLRNESPRAGQWIRLALQGAGCNRDALGARVQVAGNSGIQTQYVRSGTSYMSDHDRRLLFGIGPAQSAPIEIKWPCGAVQKLRVKARASVRVKESGCRLAHRRKGFHPPLIFKPLSVNQ